MFSRVVLPTFIFAAAAHAASVWSGVYTSAQAARGASVYTAECARCHKDDMSGYNNILIGTRFMDRWREDNLNSFYTLVRNTMPRNAPQSLSDAAYLDVVAYVLQTKSFPAGGTELTSDALPGIRVEGKEGPEAVPDFSLVEVVGCLSKGGDGDWMVTKATEPVRTRDPKDSAPEQLKTLAAKAMGAHTFRLLDPTSVQPDPPNGHKVEAKGFLIRKPGDDRLNPTSLQSVAGSCAQ
jgi:mono/diheme cytochrome c family protein